MAVAEICISGKACVFVPYPYAAEDHQTFNAMQLVKEEAACMVKDEEVGHQLMPVLMSLVHDENRMNLMQSNILQFARIDADNIIATQIINKTQNII
jgi:UDP-N-acetylglucosamine--N-acetylmuramyl-(pentapeptide) pyrophosphoryl-undecaprenol N-acetylglucosamine transferase